MSEEMSFLTEAPDADATETTFVCCCQCCEMSYSEYAILGAFHHEPTTGGLKDKWRLRMSALYHSVFIKTILRIAAFGLILLPFIEIQSSFTLSTNYSENYEAPLSPDAFWIAMSFEFLLIFILAGDAVIRGYILFCCCCCCCCCNERSQERIATGNKRLIEAVKRFPAELKTNCHLTYALYAIILFITWTLFIMSIGMPHLNGLLIARQLLRPYFLIFQVTMLKKILKAIFYTIRNTPILLCAFVLFFIVPLFFMLMAFALFPHHLESIHYHEKNYVADSDTVNEGDTYFNSSAEAYWNLIVYISTANSPDIATPAYDNDRWSFLFFGIYYFFEGFLILNILKAGYAVQFMNLIKKSMERTYNHRVDSFELAYEKLKNENGEVTLEMLRNIVDKLNLVNEKKLKELALKNDISLQNENIEKKQFGNMLFDIVHETQKPFDDLRVIKYKWPIKVLSVVVYGFSPVIAIAQFITLTYYLITDYNDIFTEPHSQMVIPMIVFSGILLLELFARLFLTICKVSPCSKETGTEATNVINQPAGVNPTTNSSNCCTRLVYWFFCGHNLQFNKSLLIFLIELFDLLLLVVVITLGFLLIPCINEGTYDNCIKLSISVNIVRATIFIIVFRTFRMLAEIPLFGIILKPLIRILVVLIPFLLLGYLFYYEFAIIGMAIFRGVNLNDTEAAKKCGSFENLEYHPYNFEDFGSTLVLLWNLMVVNNWHVMVDAYVRRTSKCSRIYFVIWWVLSETVFNGIVLGYLIEVLSVTKKNVMQNFNGESKLKTLICLFIVPRGSRYQENYESHIGWEDTFNMTWNLFDEIEYENKKRKEKEHREQMREQEQGVLRVEEQMNVH